MSTVVEPWTRAAHPHPACEVRARVRPATLAACVADVLGRGGYRLVPHGEAAFTAVRGRKGWNRYLEAAIGLVPAVGPLQYTALEVTELAPEGGRGGIRLTCRDGYQQLGAARRVAEQVTTIAAELAQRNIAPVTVSRWHPDPFGERP
ncbi:MAG TPA: hypothetical protein VGC04_13230 [Cellulomonas sp.]